MTIRERLVIEATRPRPMFGWRTPREWVRENHWGLRALTGALLSGCLLMGYYYLGAEITGHPVWNEAAGVRLSVLALGFLLALALPRALFDRVFD